MNTLKKYHSILELRTALTAGLSAFSGGAFGYYLTGEVNVTLFILMVRKQNTRLTFYFLIINNYLFVAIFLCKKFRRLQQDKNRENGCACP